jgi:lactate dehydrogenase-like 2-hydroxyacid dehydrogenase
MEALARIEAECEMQRYEGPGGQAPREALLNAVADVEGLMGSAQLPVDAGVLDAGLKLRVVSNFGVGFDNIDVAAATERGILVCNTPGVLTDAVADLTLGLVIDLSRKVTEGARLAREGQWAAGRGLMGNDLRDKLLGIVGFGRIGRAVARRARSFGMQACFYDVVEEGDPDSIECTYRSLDDLLREADFITLHVNLTDETQKLIGARELALMKPTAYLINTARGPVVDQTALTEALRENRIAGAALDVLEREPPDPDDPILSLPNAIILPHIGSATRETRQAMLDLAIDNLLTALRGETPKAVVNPEVLQSRASAT